MPTGQLEYVSRVKEQGQEELKLDTFIHYAHQNELIKIIAYAILLRIGNSIRDDRFTGMADEVMNSSNKEQLVKVLRWVDHDLVAHEDLYHLTLSFMRLETFCCA